MLIKDAEALERMAGVDMLIVEGAEAAGAAPEFEAVTSKGVRGQVGGRARQHGDDEGDGSGDDVAMESAGITLLGFDLMGIVRAHKLARATLRNIKQNLFFAFAYNTLGVPIAAGLLYPVTGLLLSPMIAAAAMSLSSVSVISNALRLWRVDL